MPPPPPPIEDGIDGDNEAMCSMLMAWYMSGYHTGYYQVTFTISSRMCIMQNVLINISTFKYIYANIYMQSQILCAIGLGRLFNMQEIKTY